MSSLASLPLSVLDLASIQEGSSIAQTFANSRALAQHVEQLGYRRFWLAEHHNLSGIASSATSVLIGNIAAATKKIRVGSGGIMLPNHAPLIIAEQFGTLDALYPGRIDLGLGRAPGSDSITMRALRRDHTSADDFPQQVAELLYLLQPAEADQRIIAIPGAGSKVPVWLLGSSTYSAQLAGVMGLPFAFAGQFAPAQLLEAVRLYRENFQPSSALTQPYVMVGVNIIAAETDNAAEHLATTMFQKFLGMVRGKRGLAQPPIESMEAIWTSTEKLAVQTFTSASIVGGASKVREGMLALVSAAGANELLINSDIFDQSLRRKSYQIIADARNEQI